MIRRKRKRIFAILLFLIFALVFSLKINFIIEWYSGVISNLFTDNYELDVLKGLADLVDPTIGTENGGHVFNGPCHPYGLVKVGFDTNNLHDFHAGYTVDGRIMGITHLHVSGTGGEPKYGVISQYPVVMPLDELNLHSYSSVRSFEKFELGYAKFGLKSYDIMVELTAGRRTGFHRYTFPPSHNAQVIVDLSHILTQGYGSRWINGAIYSVSYNQIKGIGQYTGGWNNGGPYKVYFCSQFDTNATGFATFWDGTITNGSTYQVGGNDFSLGAILTFDTSRNPVIQSRVGISFISADQACKSAETEVPDFDFNATQQSVVDAWERELSRIRIDGESTDLQKIFYSSLYRTMIMPSDRTGENPNWSSFDNYGRPIPNYDDFYALWDTFRTTNPLFTLFQPERAVDIVRSLIDIYEHVGYMPDGRSGMYNGITQGGSNADMLVAELYLKKLGMYTINWKLAYEALLKDAEVDPWEQGLYEGRLFLSNYKEIGYIPSPVHRRTAYAINPCSRTLEYSANDYSIALMAKAMKKHDDYVKYKTRARNWENLWYSNKTSQGVKGFILPRFLDGTFDTEWEVLHKNGGETPFYEGTSWEYSLDVPHDVKRLISLSGGPDAFEKRLDKTFSYGYLSSFYNIGNEPSFFHACLYHFIGKQYKSVDVIRDILKKHFNSDRGGIPGNDDSGAMGSWFVFHAMGIFPLAGQDIYLINSPHFNQSTIILSVSPIITFSIKANNLSDDNIYVQSAKINGNEWHKTWFRHSDIASGAVLELEMGNKVSKTWGVVDVDGNPIEYPPSLSDDLE
ncbi:glycoside hydrolase family 92 protein [Gigaspora margarita]|uniref:Glycoside hydrolase family 92 protein n=1 Tax=Gigaspora margarita TaxID=4874 RepID=A0A8H4AI19_GIGMA|nr:glycoside hydrolase family 92 protein [Gigaspora margarita]